MDFWSTFDLAIRVISVVILIFSVLCLRLASSSGVSMIKTILSNFRIFQNLCLHLSSYSTWICIQPSFRRITSCLLYYHSWSALMPICETSQKLVYFIKNFVKIDKCHTHFICMCQQTMHVQLMSNKDKFMLLLHLVFSDSSLFVLQYSSNPAILWLLIIISLAERIAHNSSKVSPSKCSTQPCKIEVLQHWKYHYTISQPSHNAGAGLPQN